MWGGAGGDGGRRSRKLLKEVLEGEHVGGPDLPRIPLQFSTACLALHRPSRCKTQQSLSMRTVSKYLIYASPYVCVCVCVHACVCVYICTCVCDVCVETGGPLGLSHQPSPC